MRFRLRAIALLLATLWCYPSFANSIMNYTEFKLNNGLTVVVKPDQRAPVIMCLLMYHIGASYEPNGITGISHALEHMMFKATKNYKSGDYSRIISENGGSLNAFTGTDYTGYHVQIGKDKLALVLKLEADRMANLLFDEKEFASEIKVVKEERLLRTDNVPEALTYEQFQAAAFLGIPYHNPIIGWPSDLDNMQLADLKSWYNTWYRPNNATLIVVGDVNPKEVSKLAEDYFAHIKPSALPIVKPFKSVPTYGERHITVERPAEVPLLLLGFNVPSAASAQGIWEPYALDLLASVLSYGDSSRFVKHLVRQKQLAVGVGANYGLYYRLPYLFTIQATPAAKVSIPTLQAGILAEIQQLQEQLVPQSELEKIKAQTIANDVYERDSISYQAMKLGIYASIGLPFHEDEHYKREIDKITPEQIRAVARKYLIPQQMTVAVLKPLPLESTTNQKEAN